MCQSPLGLWQPPKAGSIHRVSDSWGMNVAPGSAFLTSPQRCSGRSLRNIILVWHYQIFFFLQSFLIIITIIIIILAFSKHVWHKQSSFTLKKPDSSRKYLQKKWINTGKLFIFSMKLLQHPRTDIEKSLASPYWSCSSLEGRWDGPPTPASGPRILLDSALLGMARQCLKSCWSKAFLIFFLARMVWELG